MSAVTVVDAYLSALPGATRRLGHAEWGLTVEAEAAGGWPLDVGVRIADGLLRVQAFALPADDALNPWNLLHWNRGTRFVRYACTEAGDIWVQAELPAADVDERALDRLLGLVAEAAMAARGYLDRLRSTPPRDAAPEGWGAVG